VLGQISHVKYKQQYQSIKHNVENVYCMWKTGYGTCGV